MMSLRLPIIACLVLVAGACSDAASPHAKLHFIAAGDAVSGTVASSEPAVYRTTVKAGAQLALYLDARPTVVLSLLDDAGTIVTRVTGVIDVAGNTVTRVLVTPQRTSDVTYDIELAAPNDPARESYAIRVANVDRQPEHGASVLSPGVIAQESIDQMADVDEFTFDAKGGDEIEIYLQQLGNATTIGTYATLFGDRSPATALVSSIASALSYQDLEQGASGRITIPYTGHYRVVVQGPVFALAPYTGAYQLEYVIISPMPEHAAAELVAGDTINEAIDHVGDYDVFTLSGSPGDEFNLFLDASGGAPHAVYAQISELTRTLTAAPGGPTLLANGTGRFALPSSGSVTIRIAELRDQGDLYRGPYRLFVARIDRAPEGAPPLIIPGGPPVSGAIEVPGDIDEYSFTLASATMLNVVLSAAAPVGNGLSAAILRGSVGDSIVATEAMGPFNVAADSVSSAHLTLPAGAYRVRVQGGASTPDSYRGSYQVELRVVNPSPETAAGQVAIGDTVRTEALETAGDIDSFTFSATPADTFNIRLAMPGRTNPGINFTVIDPLTNTEVASGESTSSLADSTLQSGRLVLENGQYRIVVQSYEGGSNINQHGLYQLSLDRVSARPEHHAAAIALGDTVADERIDYIGDYDDFVLHEPAGTELFATLTWINDPQSTAFSGGALAILDSATGAVLQGTQSFGGTQPTRVAIVPASGVVRIRVQSRSLPGGYRMTTQLLDRAPETRPALFALGDTVADAVRPGPDIDDFVFNGTAGQSVDLFFQTPQGLTEPGTLQLDLIDLTTNAVISTLTSNNPTAHLEDINRRGIVLPSTGPYRVRVQSVDGAFAEGDYRFRVAASP